LREGNASNSRLRGQFDEAFILFNRARFALASSLDSYAYVRPDSEQNRSRPTGVVR
jgi:hypothetical protein